MKRIGQLILTVLLLSTFSFAVHADITTHIDFSFSNKGIVKVLYNTGKEIKVKVLIQKGDNKIYYTVKNNESYVNFPLQYGDGYYTVSIYENTTGTKYQKVASGSFDVKLDNENIVYLNSIQIIDFNGNKEAVKLATELSKSKLNDDEKTKVIYEYIAKNIEYEWEKIDKMPTDYLPDIDVTLKSKLGICYDYSSLFASMLRSQGIYSKLVKGYSVNTDVYHAWNEVYIAKDKRWVVVDLTIDAYLNNLGTKEIFEKKPTDYEKLYQY